MIEFKTLKYKHYKKSQKIYNNQNPDDPDDTTLDDVVVYAVNLVKQWDFIDEDTGEPLPVSEESINELSLGQFQELFREFNAKMGFPVKLAGDEAEDGAEDQSEVEVLEAEASEVKASEAEAVSEAEVPKVNAELSPSG